jgi:hypothetical protein
MRYILWSLAQFPLLFCFIQIRHIFRINELSLHHFDIIRYLIFAIFLLNIFSKWNFNYVWIWLLSIKSLIVLRLFIINIILKTLWKTISLINLIRLNLLSVIKLSKFVLIIKNNLFLMDAMRTVINRLKLVLSQNGSSIYLFESTSGLNSGSAVIQRKTNIISICWLV